MVLSTKPCGSHALRGDFLDGVGGLPGWNKGTSETEMGDFLDGLRRRYKEVKMFKKIKRRSRMFTLCIRWIRLKTQKPKLS